MTTPTEDAIDIDLVWPAKPLGELVGFGWGDCADADAWAALVDWADWFLATYDLAGQENLLLPCWPDHPGVVEELAALWMAWAEAAAKSRSGDGDAMAYWHDRYLAGFLARLPRYRMRSCTPETHEPKLGRPLETNGSLVQVRETALSLDSIRPQTQPETPIDQPDDMPGGGQA